MAYKAKGMLKKGPSWQGLERLQARISMADSLVIHATVEHYQDIRETKTHRRSLQDSAGNAGPKESQFNFYSCEICFINFSRSIKCHISEYEVQ